MNRMRLFIAALVVMGIAFGLGAILYSSDVASSTALDSDHSPTMGSPDAKVHIIEFLDPACEACRATFPHVKRIVAEHRGRVRLTIRHYPFHQGADYPTKVLEATRAQDKYWQALEALLASQSEWTRNGVTLPDRVWKPLQGLGIDLDRVRAEMGSAEIAQRVARDVRAAKALPVKATPEFYINGKRLAKFGVEELRSQVSAAVRQAY